jgi:hypothetical protein
MCFVWISEQTAVISVYSINWLVFITEVESVYWAVRTESLYKTDTFSLSAFDMCCVWRIAGEAGAGIVFRMAVTEPPTEDQTVSGTFIAQQWLMLQQQQ